jgi:anti-anti-sigma regulatory factor
MEFVQFRIRNKVFFVRLIGRLEFRASAAFDTVIDWIKNDKSIKRVVVDLSLATSIDSTNLGLLAQLGLYSNQKHCSVPILGAGDTPQVKQTLSKLQLNKLYRWKGDQEVFGINDAEFISVLGPGKELESKICERAISAHHALISLSESNRTEFSSVIAGLQIERALLDHRYPSDEEQDISFGDLKDLEVDKPHIQHNNQAMRQMH